MESVNKEFKHIKISNIKSKKILLSKEKLQQLYTKDVYNLIKLYRSEKRINGISRPEMISEVNKELGIVKKSIEFLLEIEEETNLNNNLNNNI